MVKIIVGLMGSSVASGSSKMSNVEALSSFLAVTKKHNVHELDTARVYNGGKSEELLGAATSSGNDDFAIATKAPGFSPGTLTYQEVTDACNASLAALDKKSIDLYYFHGPDRETPLEESCKAINQLYTKGKFRRFGVSNVTAAEVEEVQSICQRNSWVKPSVYQGGYNAYARGGEEALFPTLRKHDMAFYAFSPLAGGFFSRPSEQLRNPPQGGRMDQMSNFKSMYVSDLSLKLHEELTAVCERENLTLKEAALRWLMHHSALGEEDGVILGASSEEQMEENLVACEGGPLPASVAEAFNGFCAKATAESGPLAYSV